MKLPDINVWLALAVSGHDHHTAASAWLDREEKSRSLVLCRATQQGYFRLLTQMEVMRRYGVPPLTNAAAWAAWEALLEDERMIFQDEPPGLERQWRNFGAQPTPSTKHWLDAYLAAFAVKADLEIVTFDRGFKKFDGLKFNLLTL